MGKKAKNKAVVVVVRGVSDEEADKLTGKFLKAKRMYASDSRATIAKCPEERIGFFLQGNNQKYIK